MSTFNYIYRLHIFDDVFSYIGNYINMDYV